MTAAEFKSQFLILYDKVANLSAPPYEDSEIETFLNMAQLEFVKSHYNYKKNKEKEGTEETENRRKELVSLVRYSTLSPSTSQSGVFPNGVVFDLPTELMYTLTENAVIASDDDCIDGNVVEIKPITHDEYNAYIKNPFKKPDSSLIWRLDFGYKSSKIKHELITGDDYTITTYNLRYLKIPNKIQLPSGTILGITSELNPIVHDAIVNIAVRMATAVTKPEAYQVAATEQQISE